MAECFIKTKEAFTVMEFFELNINKDIFKKTNYYWNNLGLNSPWSIGYVTKLISNKSFKNKEEWIKYYFESGEERQRLINQKFSGEKKERVLDFLNPLFYGNKGYLTNDDTKDMLYINGYFGRTEEELLKLGEHLYRKMKERNPKTTLKFCQQSVFYRVICETWNGVIGRELNTIATLQDIYPNINFVKTSADADFKYGIDYEMRDKEDNLLLGLQIKPKSYKMAKTREVLAVKMTNDKKNSSYSTKFNAPVVYVYSSMSGKVEEEDLLEIEKIIKPIS